MLSKFKVLILLNILVFIHRHLLLLLQRLPQQFPLPPHLQTHQDGFFSFPLTKLFPSPEHMEANAIVINLLLHSYLT
jgi:hypothetical protein